MKYNEVHDHCTCQKSDLHTQFCRSILFKNSSGNVGIKLFNKLPDTIKKLEKIQEFKRRLKYFLLQHIFYSIVYDYVHFILSINTSPNRILEKSYTNVCVSILYYIIVFHKLM
jgi:hypothetical protein